MFVLEKAIALVSWPLNYFTQEPTPKNVIESPSLLSQPPQEIQALQETHSVEQKEIKSFFSSEANYNHLFKRALFQRDNVLNLRHSSNLNEEELLELIEWAADDIEVLNLSYTNATDAVLVACGRKFKNLQVLNLAGATFLTQEGCNQFAEECNTLIALNVSFMNSQLFNHVIINNRGLKEFVNNSQSGLNLKTFDISTLKLLSQCADLEIFNARGICEATDDDLKPLIENCRKLRRLNVIAWDKISNGTLENLASYSFNLESLKMGYTGTNMHLSISALTQFALHTPKLTHFFLHSYIEYSDAQFVDVLKCWEHLKKLAFPMMKNLSEDTLKQVPQLCPKLKKWTISYFKFEENNKFLAEIFNELKFLRKVKFSFCEVSGSFLNFINKVKPFGVNFESCVLDIDTFNNFNNPKLFLYEFSIVNGKVTNQQNNLGLFNLCKQSCNTLQTFENINTPALFTSEQFEEFSFPNLLNFQLSVLLNSLDYSSSLVASTLTGNSIRNFVTRIPLSSELENVLMKQTNLYSLNLSGNFTEDWSQATGKIREIFLSESDDSCVASLSQLCRSHPVNSLYFFTTAMSSENLVEVVTQRLIHIVIVDSQLTDEGMMAILKKCHALKVLEVIGESNITEKACREAKQKYPNIVFELVPSSK